MKLIPLEKNHIFEIYMILNKNKAWLFHDKKIPNITDSIFEVLSKDKEYLLYKDKQDILFEINNIDYRNRTANFKLYYDNYDADLLLNCIKLSCTYLCFKLGLNKITYSIDENEASIGKILSSIGFTLEVKYMKHFYKDGKYLNVYQYGALKNELSV